ncbi:NfeD family protein [Leptolyngbya sp. PCC 6406]|uniref:NfeD family protein n=1 Tax=Leptolyngbya sp. PCC 6406 TaxID=1173264 RepID=UPI0002AC7EAC|nr:NfeD family protein [Leptolyngbya sp. PCC 6406]
MNLLKVLFPRDPVNQDTGHLLENTLAFVPSHWPDTSLQDRVLVAIVDDPIPLGKLGHVKFQGSRWRACYDATKLTQMGLPAVPLPIGTSVRVVGRRYSTVLVVEPMDSLQPA